MGLAIALFPFDWLAETWTLFGALFDRVFVTARDHAVGHTTLFFLLGLLALLSLPALAARPVVYVALLVPAALAQEALQALFKRHASGLGDGRVLLYDLLGWCIALGALWLVRQIGLQRAARR
jgi:hypothetical protein